MMGRPETVANRGLDLLTLCPGGVQTDVPLAQISRWRVGGSADVVVRPGSVAELQALRRNLTDQGLPHLVIGSTTNLLFADEGLRAVCIQIGSRMETVTVAGQEIQAEAGAWVPGLARRAMLAGLTGAEHICGIPGTLGGLICMNGGSQRKGIGSALVDLEAVDATGELIRFDQAACGFAYRTSVFQDNGLIVARARLRFDPAPDRAAVRREMLEILSSRRRRFPQKLPNCGSVFKSNPAMYAEIGPPGAAIEKLGFKGRRIGGALVSPQHANFIVNDGGATAADVLALIAEIATAVERETGYRMEAEAKYVTPEGRFMAADQVSTP
jgi:UDP-N-acetylmuramate dehydrogenase